MNVERLDERVMPAAIRNLPGLTANTLVRQDDGPSASASLGFSINFFGVKTSSVFVNNNGNVTIGQAFSTFTPGALNSDNGGIPIIAAFFADVDTRPAASGAATYGTSTLCGYRVFGVNWFNVGYFSQHTDKLNSFQLLLISRPDTGPGNFDIEFNYNRVRWETGDASGGTNGLGGTSVAVGYSNGTGNPGTNFQLPGSLVNGAMLDGGPNALVTHRRMATTLGRYHFLVRNGRVVTSETLDVTRGTKVTYPFRYFANPRTRTLQGVMTLQNIGRPGGNNCLDIVTVANSRRGSYPGPITIVFPKQLAYGARVANPSGYTSTGRPYITVRIPNLPYRTPVARLVIRLRYTVLRAPTSYFIGAAVRVYSGPFDRTDF